MRTDDNRSAPVSGELPPFEQLVQVHGSLVHRVCRAVLGPVDADDAWSETFLAALRAYPELPPGANVEAWLVTIAHRKAIDGFRARARRPLPVAEVRLGHTPPAQTDTDGAGLEDALHRLTERQRLAVAYHHLGGLPYAEVADLLGGSPAAARRAAADGIAKLRRWLQPEGGR